ncbi:MAG: MFS transporter, partial [Pseudomonadota bacterium]|nr:MFS transporter [Pseudomonadota bacterium]
MASVAETQQQKPWSMARVITASSAGTAFEWYDFFIFGSLAPVISRVFFAGLDPTPALIAALGLFAAGFAFRPLGALIFGVVGDRLGRKGAFLITVSLMGGATFLIGVLPTYAQAGILAPALIAALGLFAAGFAFRPLGALIFGVIGDRLGRKGAFLITVSLMGGATFLIGVLPTYAQAGILAPALLILLR